MTIRWIRGEIRYGYKNDSQNGDPQLRKHCHEVKDFNPRLHMLLDDMRQTLAESNGVGLAAPQVGVLRRAVIVLETNVPDGEEEYMIELINPPSWRRPGSRPAPRAA